MPGWRPLPPTSARPWYYLAAIVPVVLIFAAFIIAIAMLMKLLGMTGMPGAVAFTFALLGGVVIAWGAGKLITFLLARMSGFGNWWHQVVAGQWNARMRDHRMVMVGAGFGALALSIGLFGTLPMTFQPPLNLDFSTVNITLAPGTTLKQTEEVADQVAALVRKDPDVEARVRAHQCRIGAGQHRPQEGSRPRPAPSSSASMRRSCRRSPTAASASRARAAADLAAIRATSCCSSAATTRTSWSPPPTRLPRKWAPSPAFARRASAATWFVPKS